MTNIPLNSLTVHLKCGDLFRQNSSGPVSVLSAMPSRPYDSGESSRENSRQVEERIGDVSQEIMPRHPARTRRA